MKVTIITAVYNNVQNIEQAIHSVQNQTYKNIEHIVIDGNSSDGTKELLEKHKSSFSFYISEPDNGIYDALNKGLKQATGDIIGFLHSDDLFANEQIIETIVDTFISHSCHGVYGDLLYVNRENPDVVIRNWKSTPYNTSLLKKGWMPPHPTLFLRKQVYDENGLFDTSFKIAADYNFILKIFSNPKYSFIYIPTVFTRMRIGGKSSTIKNLYKKSKEDYIALRSNRIGGFYTLFVKNFSKIGQFFMKKK
ncbi:MAG: glycosyltransferase family 2 protein [Bacteroidales bacterium]